MAKKAGHKSAGAAPKRPAPKPSAKAPAKPPPPPPPPPPTRSAIPRTPREEPPGKKLEPLPSSAPGRASSAGPRTGVVIVGSLNMDLIARAETMPLPGQTVSGQDLLQTPGGKGANQAAAAGKLWHRRTLGSRMIGRIGDDLFGEQVLAALTRSKVETDSILRTRNTPTGTAMIVVDRHGENAIVLAGGANRHLSATDLLAERRTIESAVVLLLQLEVPQDTVACALALAKRSNVLTILDPAPAPPEGLPDSLYHVDILTPNQIEAQALSGVAVRTPDDARRAGERLLLRGPRIVIIKMASQGAVIIEKSPTGAAVARHITGYRVVVVDSTAAGDAFNAALGVALAEGTPLDAAVKFANAAGALACTRPGAIAAMPTRAEVETLMTPV